jgi:hypothetical protein
VPLPRTEFPLHPRQVKILSGLSKLFHDPAKHTTGAAARDANGEMCFVVSKHATCFCALGGLMKVDRDLGGEGAVDPRIENAMVETFIHLRHMGRAGGDAALVSINERGSFVVDEAGESRIGREAVIELCEQTIKRHAVSPETGRNANGVASV